MKMSTFDQIVQCATWTAVGVILSCKIIIHIMM